MIRFLLLALFASSATAQPIAVEAKVDSGVELAAIGLWLSGSYPTPPDSQYKTDVWTHFGPHRDHPGLDVFRGANMYPDFTELGLLLDLSAGARRSLPDSIPWLGTYGRDTLQTMLDGLLEFARDADFNAFRERHQTEYAQWETEAESSLRQGGALDALDAFFGTTAARKRPSVRVLLEPLNGWGAHAITVPELVEEVGGPEAVVYQIGPAWDIPKYPDATLSFARDDGSLAWHEAAHVYLGNVLEASVSDIAALERLFDTENGALQQQNVTTWKYAFEENLVRAIVVALTRQERGLEAADRMVRQEERSGFVYVGQIAALIQEGYLDGGGHAQGFEAFVPRVLDALAVLDGVPHSPGSLEAARAYAARQRDPAVRNVELFAVDSTYASRIADVDVPIQIGVFPVATYDSPGNGSGDVSVTIGGHTLAGHFANVGRSPDTETSFAGLADDAEGAVNVIVLVVSGKPGQNYASSRSHPTYLAEGRIGTFEGGVDWVSLVLRDQPDLAIVNTRVFDLRVGRTIVVAPLNDGTLRFLQVETPPFAMGGLEAMSTFGDLLGPALDTPTVQAFLDNIASRLPESP